MLYNSVTRTLQHDLSMWFRAMWSKAHHRDSVHVRLSPCVLVVKKDKIGPQCVRYPDLKQSSEAPNFGSPLISAAGKSGNRHLQKSEPRNTSTTQARWLRQDEPHRDHLNSKICHTLTVGIQLSCGGLKKHEVVYQENSRIASRCLSRW